MAKLVSKRGAALLLPKNRVKANSHNDAFDLSPKDLDIQDIKNERLRADSGFYPGGLVTNAGNAEANPDGIEMSTADITTLVEQALARKLHSMYALHFGDHTYYLPSINEVKQILIATQRERRSWIPERYDCDDFAYVLKAFTSSVAYMNSGLTFGLCYGIIWGQFKWLNEFHACNWVIDSNKTFLLIEPQTDTILCCGCMFRKRYICGSIGFTYSA